MEQDSFAGKKPREEAPEPHSITTVDTAKQDHEEFAGLDDIRPCRNAAIHGLLLDLSPVKTSKTDKRYFDGHLTDESKRPIRFVGFSTTHHDTISAFQSDKQPLALLRYQVQPARQGNKDLEILLDQSVVIERSPCKFHPEQCQPTKLEPAPLRQLKDKLDFTRFSTTAKAIHVNKPILVAGGKKKQDIVIADDSATAALTLWEEDIDRIVKGQTYSFSNLIVKTFRQKKQLSVPKDATVTTDGDMTDVVEESSDNDSDVDTLSMQDVEVIAVPTFSSYTACITCHSKVEPKSAATGCCTKCNMPQRLDKCARTLSAKIIVQTGTMQRTLQVFGPQLVQITGKEQSLIDVETLLTAPPCCIKYNQRQIITSVYWHT